MGNNEMLHSNAKIFSDIAETSVEEATDVLLETMNAYHEVSVADALKTIGVRLTNDFGEYKSLPTVLSEISDKWDGLSKDDQDKVCYAMAGDEDEVKARNCTEEIVVTSEGDFDKQENFQWIAKSAEDGKYHVGFIYVDMPWYSQESEWTYYIKWQVNTSGWGCQHWEECIVEKDSIRPYTIRNRAWLNDQRNIDTLFVTGYFDDREVLGTNIDDVTKVLQNKK